MSSISYPAPTLSASQSGDPTGRPSPVNTASQNADSDDDDIIFINSSDIPLTSSRESLQINEGPYVTRIEMSTNIRKLEEKISKAEDQWATEAETLYAEVARLKDVISKVVNVLEDTMTCDVMYTSSHKAFVLSCGHIFSQDALQTHFETHLHATIRSRPDQLTMLPPYDSAKLQWLRVIGHRWAPICPMCRTRILTPPQEVKRLTKLAKTIRTLAAGEGLGEEVDEESRESYCVWNAFFKLRLV